MCKSGICNRQEANAFRLRNLPQQENPPITPLPLSHTQIHRIQKLLDTEAMPHAQPAVLVRSSSSLPTLAAAPNRPPPLTGQKESKLV
jgi:hypothetical protein